MAKKALVQEKNKTPKIYTTLTLSKIQANSKISQHEPRKWNTSFKN